MSKGGPIIIIDDDADDCMMVRDVLAKIKPQHEVVYLMTRTLLSNLLKTR